MSVINEKDVEHIASLARIKLDAKEKDKLAKDLGDILSYIDKLKEVDTEGVEPVAHITGIENVFRKDEETDVFFGTKPEELVKQAPASDRDNFVKVKAVFENKK